MKPLKILQIGFLFLTVLVETQAAEVDRNAGILTKGQDILDEILADPAHASRRDFIRTNFVNLFCDSKDLVDKSIEYFQEIEELRPLTLLIRHPQTDLYRERRIALKAIVELNRVEKTSEILDAIQLVLEETTRLTDQNRRLFLREAILAVAHLFNETCETEFKEDLFRTSNADPVLLRWHMPAKPLKKIELVVTDKEAVSALVQILRERLESQKKK